MKRKIMIVFLVFLFLPFTFMGNDKEFFADEITGTSPISSNGGGGLAKEWEETYDFSYEEVIMVNDSFYFLSDESSSLELKRMENGTILLTEVIESNITSIRAAEEKDGFLYISGVNEESWEYWLLKIESSGQVCWEIEIKQASSLESFQNFILSGELDCFEKISPEAQILGQYNFSLGEYHVITSIEKGENCFYALEHDNADKATFLSRWNSSFEKEESNYIGSKKPQSLLVQDQKVSVVFENEIKTFDATDLSLLWSSDLEFINKVGVIYNQGFLVAGSDEDEENFIFQGISSNGSKEWTKSWMVEEGSHCIDNMIVSETTIYLFGSVDDSTTILSKWIQDQIAPTINELSDRSYEQADSLVSIDVWPEDENPHNYSIYRNGALISSGLWDSGEKISAEINLSMDLNSYSYEFVFEDISGNQAIEGCVVTIQDTTPPQIIRSEYSNDSEEIVWGATDRNPDSYIVYKDGEEVSSGSWVSGGEVSIIVSPEKRESLNYTIVFKDISGNSQQSFIVISPLLSSSNGVGFFAGWNWLNWLITSVGFIAIIILVVIVSFLIKYKGQFSFSLRKKEKQKQYQYN